MRGFVLFVAILSSPAVACAQDPGNRQFQAAVDEMRDAVMARGEQVPDWNRGAADPTADLRRRGAETHYLFNRNSDEDSVSIVTDRAIVDFAPDDWVVVDSYRLHDPARTGAVVDFVPLSHRFVFASRAVPVRIGGVDCFDNLDHALLYERPGAVTSAADADARLEFRTVIRAMEDTMLCVRYDGSADDGYTRRTFTPDGHSLPALDREGEEAWIVEARPIDHYVAYRADDGFNSTQPD